MASNTALPGSESPDLHINNTIHDDESDIADIDPDSSTDNYDADSALGDDHKSSTASLPEADLVERHGREYHSYQGGEYLLPNDERERVRLAHQHELFWLTLNGRLHVALLPPIHRALDMGTGTGIWAVDFAERNPTAEIYGIDLSPIQPTWVPPNCIFQVDDLSLPWTFELKFDFIHGRSLFHSFSDPLHIFQEAFRTLAGGGILEMQDVIFDFRSPDDSLKGSALEEWSKKLEEAFKSKGIDLTCVSNYRNYFEVVGFEDIQQEEFTWPVGTWTNDESLKTLGQWCQTNILDMLHAISILPLTTCQPEGMSPEAVEVLLARVRQDLQDPSIHAYLQVLVIHGRKPKSVS